MKLIIFFVLCFTVLSHAQTHIVVLNEDAPRVGNVKREYRSFNAYAADLTVKQVNDLRRDPRVKYVEPNAMLYTQAVQQNATWGIARIDQRAWQYPLSTDYEYDATGAGVTVFIIDTGINITHPDFNGRAVKGFGNLRDISDCNGHGTHVAGTVGSTTYGVAKQVKLVSVRVFPCWGGAPVSDVVAGVDWVNRQKKATSPPMVANMSLGGAYTQALEDAVQVGINKGITYVVAAGNSNRDACQESPAHVAEAITVGMTDQRDYRADISNYGPCVDVFAPGAAIKSTGNMPNYPYEHIMSGTSTASPHVAGVAALYLETHSSASPAEVHAVIVTNATAGILTDAVPNLFLYSIF